MSRVKSLLKSTAILMIAKISTQVVSFLLLPLYTALLTTSEYGEIDVYTSLAMIIIPFLTLQLEMGLFRFFITAEDEDEKRSIISTSFIIIAIDLSVVSIVYLVIANIVTFKYSGYLYGYYLSLTINAVLLQVCRAEGNNKAYGFASFLASSIGVALNALFIAGFHWKVEGILLATIIAQNMSSIYMLFRTKAYNYFSAKDFNKQIGGKLLNYSVPLIFNQISSWVINYSDRFIILYFWGTALNGIYAVSNKFSNITSTFFGVYNVAWTENVVRSLKDKDNVSYISKVFKVTFDLYMILITGIINLLPFFYDLLINEKFFEAYYHVPILLLGMFFSGMAATLGSIYIAYNKTRNVGITTTLAAVTNIAIHLALLRTFKLYAASISTLIAFGALFLYRYLFIQKFFPIKYKARNMLIPVSVFAFSWYAYAIQNKALILIGLAINLITLFKIFYSNKAMILNLLKRK